MLNRENVQQKNFKLKKGERETIKTRQLKMNRLNTVEKRKLNLYLYILLCYVIFCKQWKEKMKI